MQDLWSLFWAAELSSCDGVEVRLIKRLFRLGGVTDGTDYEYGRLGYGRLGGVSDWEVCQIGDMADWEVCQIGDMADWEVCQIGDKADWEVCQCEVVIYIE